jgi:hypothetical protein
MDQTTGPSMLPAMRFPPSLGAAATMVAAVSCGGGNVASQLVKAPDYEPKGQTQCAVSKSQTRPLVVEWPSSDRLELETKARESVVVVRYVGCQMDVLERCSVQAKYRYLGGTRKEDRLVVRNADDLYANLPVGAARLEGKLETSGQLTVDMDLVGRYEAETSTVKVGDLGGDCAGATHFVYGVTVGAFDFYAGGAADVGAGANVAGIGAGARAKADRETITRDGEVGACAAAKPDDTAPPVQCGALVRVEVVPLVGAAPNPFVGEWKCTETVTSPSGKTVTGEIDDVVTDNGDGTVQGVTRAPGVNEPCSKRFAVSGDRATLAGEQTCTLAGRTMTAKTSVWTVVDASTHSSTGTGTVPGIGEIHVNGTCVRR